MELWDILDAEGNKIGKTIKRGQPLGDGEYFLAAHIYIINRKGEFLIQKRSMKKELWPGRWDVTGGVVVSGEDSLTGAIREVEEELGIALVPEMLVYIRRLRKKQNFIDIWAAFADISIDDISMQEGEVDAVKFVSADDMVDIIFNGEYRDDEYKNVMMNYLKTLNK